MDFHHRATLGKFVSSVSSLACPNCILPSALPRKLRSRAHLHRSRAVREMAEVDDRQLVSSQVFAGGKDPLVTLKSGVEHLTGVLEVFLVDRGVVKPVQPVSQLPPAPCNTDPL